MDQVCGRFNGTQWYPLRSKRRCLLCGQKPELTRLVDSNKDGICDRYETVTDQFGISGEYHEYHFGPVMDSLGRKYASLNLGARGEFTVPDGKPFGKGGGNMSYNAPWQADGSTAPIAKATFNRSLPGFVPPAASESVQRMKSLSPTTRVTGWRIVPSTM